MDLHASVMAQLQQRLGHKADQITLNNALRLLSKCDSVGLTLRWQPEVRSRPIKLTPFYPEPCPITWPHTS